MHDLFSLFHAIFIATVLIDFILIEVDTVVIVILVSVVAIIGRKVILLTNEKWEVLKDITRPVCNRFPDCGLWIYSLNTLF